VTCGLIREPYELQMFGNKVLNKIYGCKKGGNYKYRHLYRSANLVRIRWTKHMSRMGEMRNVFRILVVKSLCKCSVRKSKLLEG
jgi:hypothetical protein